MATNEMSVEVGSTTHAPSVSPEISVPEAEEPVLCVQGAAVSEISSSEPEDSNVVEKLSYTVESWLRILHSGRKPWYLTTSEVYSTVKTAVSSIPMSAEVVDAGIKSIVTIIDFVNEKTNKKSMVFTADQCYEMMQKVDTHLADIMVKADDGVDNNRAKLAVSLRSLLHTLSAHKQIATKLAAKTAHDFKNRSQTVGRNLQTRFEQMMLAMDELKLKMVATFPKEMGILEERCQATYAGAQYAVDRFVAAEKTFVESGVSHAKEAAVNATTTAYYSTAYALKVAQPYVQTAVVTGTPYLSQLCGVAVPYIRKAQPFVVAKALQIESAAAPLLTKGGPVLEKVGAAKYLETLKNSQPVVEAAMATTLTTLEDYTAFQTTPEISEMISVLVEPIPLHATAVS